MNPMLIFFDVFKIFFFTAVLWGSQAIASPNHALWRLVYLLFGAYFLLSQKSMLACFQRLQNKKGLITFFVVIASAGFLFHAGHAYLQIIRPIHFMDDISGVYLQAIRGLFLEHPALNPYSGTIDPACVYHDQFLDCFNGLKYAPLQVFTYAPLMLAYGQHGTYLTHLFCYFGMAYLLFSYLKKLSPLHAALGMAVYFWSEPVSVIAFNNGSNDPLPALLSFLALLLMRKTEWKRRNLVVGVLLGLSLLAKQLPGGLLAISLLFAGEFSVLMIASLVFGLVCLPFLIWDSGAFFQNVILFQLHRNPGNSSIAFLLPKPWSQWIVPLGVLLYLGFQKNLRKLKPQDWLGPYIWGGILFLLCAKMSPFHYFTWFLPPLILWALERLSDSSDLEH